MNIKEFFSNIKVKYLLNILLNILVVLVIARILYLMIGTTASIKIVSYILFFTFVILFFASNQFWVFKNQTDLSNKKIIIINFLKYMVGFVIITFTLNVIGMFLINIADNNLASFIMFVSFFIIMYYIFDKLIFKAR